MKAFEPHLTTEERARIFHLYEPSSCPPRRLAGHALRLFRGALYRAYPDYDAHDEWNELPEADKQEWQRIALAEMPDAAKRVETRAPSPASQGKAFQQKKRTAMTQKKERARKSKVTEDPILELSRSMKIASIRRNVRSAHARGYAARRKAADTLVTGDAMQEVRATS